MYKYPLMCGGGKRWAAAFWTSKAKQREEGETEPRLPAVEALTARVGVRARDFTRFRAGGVARHDTAWTAARWVMGSVSLSRAPPPLPPPPVASAVRGQTGLLLLLFLFPSTFLFGLRANTPVWYSRE
jgi:hypothetical protein